MYVTHLRVRARGQALVQNLEAFNANPRRFVGREWTVENGVAALKPVDGDVEVPARAEYVAAVKHGDLWAADRETAEHCGVEFDPHFGETPAPQETALAPVPAAAPVVDAEFEEAHAATKEDDR